MRLEVYKEASQIWSKGESKSASEKLAFELNLYKKFLSFLQVGAYYYIIFNYSTKNAEFVSDEMETMLGYSVSEYDVPFVLSKVHPDDLNHLLNMENRAMDFLLSLPVDKLLKYKISYDYRIQKNDGNYIRILQQGLVLEYDEHGGMKRTLIVHTDISHIKQMGKPVLSFIGLEGEPSYINVDVQKKFNISKEFLTRREKEVLNLLIEGKLSKEIAYILNISNYTVEKHRKNMLAKHKLNNTGELIGKAIKQGWL